VGLAGEQLGGEVADVCGLDVDGGHVGVGQRARDGVGEHRAQRLVEDAGPVGREVGLRPAEHEHLFRHDPTITPAAPVDNSRGPSVRPVTLRSWPFRLPRSSR
jgi:hypothetical protein